MAGSVSPTDIVGSSGSNGQVLTTNGTSSLSWSNKTVDTNTTYTAGDCMKLNGTQFNANGVVGVSTITTGSATKTLTTTMSAVNSTYYKVIFSAPKSGKVFIQAQVHQDAVSSSRYFYYDIRTSGTSNTPITARHRIDETDDVNQTVGKLISGLTSGTSYTYYLYARCNATTCYLRYGGSYGAPYMVAWACP